LTAVTRTFIVKEKERTGGDCIVRSNLDAELECRGGQGGTFAWSNTYG